MVFTITANSRKIRNKVPVMIRDFFVYTAQMITDEIITAELIYI